MDTTIVEEARRKRDWDLAYSLIPKCNVYEGMNEVFSIIRQYGLDACIVSTSPRTYIERIVEHFNIPIDRIVAYHDAKPIKPHPAPMLKALELLNCHAKDAISFGGLK